MIPKPTRNAENILVLCLGGTINGDHRQTVEASMGPHKTTQIKVYHDEKGRVPAQIYIEDVLHYENVTFKELAAKDSKALDDEDRLKLCDEILQAKVNGYTRVLVITGTDTAPQLGSYIQFACMPHPAVPVILVTAMKDEEMTRDMDLATNRFVRQATEGIGILRDALTARLAPGVYIKTANAGYANPLAVEKDFINRQFIVKPRRGL